MITVKMMSKLRSERIRTCVSAHLAGGTLIPVFCRDQAGNYISFSGGGNQEWFSEKSARKRGCGVVAASNALAYMSVYGGCPELYGFSDFTQENYLKYMNEMLRYIKPALWGVTPSKLIKGVTGYAYDRGCGLHACVYGFNSESSIASVADFAASAIASGCPPVMLAGYNSKLRWYYVPGAGMGTLNFHWMTVTGVEYDAYTQKGKFTIATWGYLTVIDIDIYMKTLYKFMTYFVK